MGRHNRGRGPSFRTLVRLLESLHCWAWGLSGDGGLTADRRLAALDIAFRVEEEKCKLLGLYPDANGNRGRAATEVGGEELEAVEAICKGFAAGLEKIGPPRPLTFLADEPEPTL